MKGKWTFAGFKENLETESDIFEDDDKSVDLTIEDDYQENKFQKLDYNQEKMLRKSMFIKNPENFNINKSINYSDFKCIGEQNFEEFISKYNLFLN